MPKQPPIAQTRQLVCMIDVDRGAHRDIAVYGTLTISIDVKGDVDAAKRHADRIRMQLGEIVGSTAVTIRNPK